MINLDGLLTRAIVWVREKQRKRIAAQWERNAYLAELDKIQQDIDRAERIKRNRSNGARAGWETRRANAMARANERYGLPGATVVSAPLTATSNPGGYPPTTQPDTWDDHDFDVVPSA